MGTRDLPNMYALDLFWENLSFEIFDLPFDHVHWCTLRCEVEEGYMAYVFLGVKALHVIVITQV